MHNTFKVIKIIDEYSIVINVGAQDVAVGTVFEIYQPGQEVRDPDTGEFLGSLDYVKAQVIAVNVLERFSVFKNVSTKTFSPLSPVSAESFMSNFSNLLQERTVRLPLNVNVSDISGGFESTDKTIHVGDLARVALTS